MKSAFGQFIEIGLILVASAIFVLVSFLVYYKTGDHYAGDAIAVFDHGKLRLMAGGGEDTADGLIIRQLSARGFALVSSSPVRLPADTYSELQWRIDGLDEHTEIHFVWITQAKPEELHGVMVIHDAKTSGRVALADTPGWEESIGRVGLRIQGSLTKPLVLHSLVLKAATPDIRVLLARIWGEWSAFEGWSGHSINYIVGGPVDSLFPIVPAVAAWVALSCLTYGVLIVKRRQAWTLAPFAVFFMCGWLLLDAHWQWNLWRQLKITYHQFAGKSWEQKHLGDEDGKLFSFMQEVKKRLPTHPVRIFLVSADPEASTKYERLRAHYHLLPHNVYSLLSEPPPSDKARAGDYVLILKPIQGIRYARNGQEISLFWNDKSSLSVEAIYAEAKGFLFRIRDDS